MPTKTTVDGSGTCMYVSLIVEMLEKAGNEIVYTSTSLLRFNCA